MVNPSTSATFEQAMIIDNMPQNDSEIIARLAALQPMHYDRIRKEEAKALGIQVKTLDDLIKKARNEGDAVNQMPFTEIESHLHYY
jgi:hypothetical protein